jgi:hypothetical protein
MIVIRLIMVAAVLLMGWAMVNIDQPVKPDCSTPTFTSGEGWMASSTACPPLKTEYVWAANPERLADCIAEQSYTHQMSDKFRELVNAVRICQQIVVK